MGSYRKIKYNTNRKDKRDTHKRFRDPFALKDERMRLRDQKNKSDQIIEDIDDGLEKRVTKDILNKIKR